MKCPKCNKEMYYGSYLQMHPADERPTDYWFCPDSKNCKYEVPITKAK